MWKRESGDADRHDADTLWTPLWTWAWPRFQVSTEGPRQAGGGGGPGCTHVLHALDVSFDLLQHAGMPLRLLRAPHALVDALGHLLDVPLRVQQEWVVRVVLGRVLQEVLG